MKRRLEHLRRELLDRPKIVQDKDSPPVRPDDEIVFSWMNRQVINRRRRQVLIRRMPVFARVNRHIQSEQDKDSPPVRPDDEIVFSWMNRQVKNRRRRQV